MADTIDPLLTALAVTVSRPDRVFPTLTPEQVARIATHGRRRPTTRGEVLIEVGDRRRSRCAAPGFRQSLVLAAEAARYRRVADCGVAAVAVPVGEFIVTEPRFGQLVHSRLHEWPRERQRLRCHRSMDSSGR